MYKRTYDFPIADWISMGLHKKSLHNSLEAINKNNRLENIVKQKASNRAYLGKILREEVLKQFADRKRPMLEVVLNAIDARSWDTDEEYHININMHGDRFKVRDNGRGMNLDEILRLLIVPFSTEKNGIEQIGRFGVGFLAALNYCTYYPMKNKVIVDTSTGKEGYRAEFYSETDLVDGLRMKLKKHKFPHFKGTDVLLKVRSYDKEVIKEYLFEHLRGVPSYTAKLFLNRKPMNDIKGNRWYAANVNLKAFGKTIKQQVGFKTSDRNQIFLTAQGVLVDTFNSTYGGATISFPAAVKVVEGRDEFKLDENYKTAVKGAFKALEKYIKEEVREEGSRQDVLSFIPSLASAFSKRRIKDIPNIEGITNALLPDKKYVLIQKQMKELEPFLGEKIKNLAFVTSPTACSYWREIYGSEKEIRNDLLKPVEVYTQEEFEKKMFTNKKFYPNLQTMFDYLGLHHNENKIVLIDSSPVGKDFMMVGGNSINKKFYINIAHPYVKDEINPTKMYSIFSDFLQISEIMRGEDIEGKENAEERLLEWMDCIKAVPPSSEWER